MGRDYLKRYTNIPSLIYLLKNRALTFLDPKSWDDRNDSHYLSIYKHRKSFKSVLALCFTEVGETYHHWHVFAAGPSGVCVTFNRAKIINSIPKEEGFKYGSVEYFTLRQARKKAFATDQLPFMKRHAFQDESEFRMMFESKTARASTKDVRIPLSSIEKITLSPWIPDALAGSLMDTLRTIKGCDPLRIGKSSLVNNSAWKKLVDDGE